MAACEEETEALPGIPLEQFAQELQGVQCERLVRCNLSPDLDACRASIPTEPGIAQAVTSVTAGDLVYDPSAARTCVETVRAGACEGGYTLTRTLRETCDAVFKQRKGEGEPCFNASECEGLDATCEGTSNNNCAQGTCKLAGGSGSLGTACGDMMPCAPDLVCQANMMGMPVCSSKSAAGEDCASPYDCIDGHGCDPSTNTCFKQATSGAQCNPDLAAPGCASVGEYCDAMQRKCLPLPGTGEACITNAYLTNACAPWALCTGEGSTCVRMPAANEPCNQGYCIGLLDCSDADVCQPLAASPTCSL